jgi:hypothetical protein
MKRVVMLAVALGCFGLCACAVQVDQQGDGSEQVDENGAALDSQGATQPANPNGTDDANRTQSRQGVRPDGINYDPDPTGPNPQPWDYADPNVPGPHPWTSQTSGTNNSNDNDSTGTQGTNSGTTGAR